MKKSKQELKTYFETGDKPTEGQYADLIDSYVDSKQEKGDSNRRFVIDEDGEVSVDSEQNIPEYTLSEISDNKLGLLKDGVVVKEIDLATYIDDTNLSRLVSGDLNKTTGILTVIREDNSSFNIDLSSLTNEVPEKQTIDELFLSDNATVPLSFSGSGSSSSITSNQMRVNGGRSYGFVNSSLIGVEAQDASSQTHIEKDSLVIRENGKNTSLESGSPTKDVKVALPSESGKLVIESAIPEYTLSEIIANKLSLLKNGVVVKEIDLTSYVDDTNLARLISGTVGADGMATFKRDDDSTFTVDFNSLLSRSISLNDLGDVQSDINNILIGTKEKPDSDGEMRGVNNVILGKDTILDGVGDDNVLIGKSVLGGLGKNGNNNSNNNVIIGSKAAEDRINFNDNVIVGGNSVTVDGSGNRNIIIGSNIEIGGYNIDDQLNIGDVIKGDLKTKTIELEKLMLRQLEEGDVDADECLTIDSSGIVKKIKLTSIISENISSESNNQVQANWNQVDNSKPNYIENKPTNLSGFNNDTNFITQNDVSEIKAGANISIDRTDPLQLIINSINGITIDEKANMGVGPRAGDKIEGSSNYLIGFNSGDTIKGSYNMIQGLYSGRKLEGLYNVMSGAYTGDTVTGNRNIGVGQFSSMRLIGEGNVGVGSYSLQVMYGNNNGMFGTGVAYDPPLDHTKKYVIEASDVTSSAEIIIKNHGFPIGSRKMFYYEKDRTDSTSETLVNIGWRRPRASMWEVIDVNTLKCLTETYIGNAVGRQTFTEYLQINNSTGIGHGVKLTKSNQMVLGDNKLEEISTEAEYQGKSFKLNALNIAPSSSTDIGKEGEIRYTTDYIYVCVATNIWKRSPITTW